LWIGVWGAFAAEFRANRLGGKFVLGGSFGLLTLVALLDGRYIGVALKGDHLGDDSDGDLLGRNGADFEADGSHYFVEQVLG
jgi:hypothetical protein